MVCALTEMYSSENQKATVVIRVGGTRGEPNRKGGGSGGADACGTLHNTASLAERERAQAPTTAESKGLMEECAERERDDVCLLSPLPRLSRSELATQRW